MILGNGPSLKGVDLQSLSTIDTLGMNAAYRYWERIDWYPTHYVCLDDQLIETHASAINDLIVRGKVKTAFLIAKILDYYPDLINHPKVFFLESFNGTRQKRVADKGIPFIPSTSFRESDASKVTTGSYSVRFAAFLGYNEISILGIDLRYVEIIDEAKSTEGIKLEMVSTPKSNPNYFFDDYQRAGDKYNIPNPAAHDGNLHVKSFQVMTHDIEKFGWNVKVYNSNPESILEDNKILPLVPLKDFLPPVNMKQAQQRKQAKKLFVAGNGPSLRNINFEHLESIDWLGMNAAYRYWDEIGIYPTIYCCLDRVVVKAHAKEIKRLIAEGNIQHYFLVKDVLEVVPELEHCPQVYFLEDLCALNADSAKIFKTDFSDKITTGSWALRFSIFLGYKELYLAGIDCNYTEIVEGAEHTGKHNELVIKSEKSNPNYFFSGYQKEGDLYQVPNPSRHFGNLHLQSFEALNIDIETHDIDVDIYNLAETSQLHRVGIYPLVPATQAFDQPDLQAIAVPLTKGELPQLLKNIELLDLPAFSPLRSQSSLIGKVYFHVFFDCEFSQDIQEQLSKVWGATRYLQHQFKELRVTFLDIPSEINLYARNRPDATFSTKSGPNVHFFSLIEMSRGYKNVFLMECDCVPTRADWLSDLNEYCRSNKEFWIAGSFISELGSVDPAIATHINGNSLYATGNDDFADFIETVMKPSLFYYIYEAKSFHLAYDCLLAKIQSYGTAFRLRRDNKKPSDGFLMNFFYQIQKHLHRFVHTEILKNISHVENDLTNSELVSYLDSDHTIVHSKKLTNLLVEHHEKHPFGDDTSPLGLSLKRFFKDTYLRADDTSQLVTHYYSNKAGLEFRRLDRGNSRALLATKAVTKSENETDNHGAYIVYKVDDLVASTPVTCELSLKSDVDQEVLIKFSRDGSGAYVEKKRTVTLKAGVEKNLTLNIVCKDAYKKLKLFVKPVEEIPTLLQIDYLVFKGQKNTATSSVILVDVNDSTRKIHTEFKKQGEKLKAKLEMQNKPKPTTALKVKKTITAPHSECYTPPINDVVKALALEDRNQLCSLLSGVRDSYLPSLRQAISRSKKYKWLLPTLESFADGDENLVPNIVYVDPVHRDTASATQELRKRLLKRYPAKKVVLVHPSWFKRGQWEVTVKNKTQVMPIDDVIALINGLGDTRVLVRTGFLGDIGLELYFNLMNVKHKLIALVMDTWDIRLKGDKSDKAKKLIESFNTLLNQAHSTISITEDMSEYIHRTYEVENRAVAHNFIPYAKFAQMKASVKGQVVKTNTKLTYLYSGGLEEDMTYGGLLEFIQVVGREEQLKSKIKLVVKTFKRHESQSLKVIEVCKANGVEHQVICEDMTKDEYDDLVNKSDVYFIPYVDSKTSSEYVLYSYPNKFSDYLENQKPIIYFGPDYAINRIITRLGVEGVYNVNNAQKLAQVVTHINGNYDSVSTELKAETSKIIAEFGEEKILSDFFSKVI